MNTKVPKKILSVFLSMLMILSCITAGLVAVAEDVGTSAPVKALQKAVNAWIASGEDDLVSAYAAYDLLEDGDNRVAYIQDNTSAGYIFDIAEALVPVVNAEMSTDAESGANSVARMRERIREITGFTTGAGAAVITALLPDPMEYDSDYKQSLYVLGMDTEFPELGTTTVEVGRTLDAALVKAGKFSDVKALPSIFAYSFDSNSNTGSGTALSRTYWYSYAGAMTTSYKYYEDELRVLKNAYAYFSANMGTVAELVRKGADLTASDADNWNAVADLALSEEAFAAVFGAITPAAVADYMTDSLAAAEILNKKAAAERFVTAEITDFSAYDLDALTDFFEAVKADYDLIVKWDYVAARDYFASNYGYTSKGWSAFVDSVETALATAEFDAYEGPQAEAFNAKVAAYFAAAETVEEIEALTSVFSVELTDVKLVELYNEGVALEKAGASYKARNSKIFDTLRAYVSLLAGEIAARNVAAGETKSASSSSSSSSAGNSGATAAQRSWPGYTPNSLVNQSEYCTRRAEIAQNGSAYQDIARHKNETDGANSNNDNYVVKKTIVTEVIKNIDAWLASDEFAQLLTTALEKGENADAYAGINSLSGFIIELFNQKLFNDEMLNKLMQLIFCDLVGSLPETIIDALADMGQKNAQNPDTQVYINIDINEDISVAGIDNVDGDVYLNGGHGTLTFPQLFAALGLKVYPGQLADYFSAYPTVKNALNAAGSTTSSWDTFLANNSNEDGDLDFVWGCTDFNGFKQGLTSMLSGILPLLQCLLCNNTYTGSVDNFAYLDLTLHCWLGALLHTSKKYYGKGTAPVALSIRGINGFRDVIVPIFEALGIPSTQISIPGSTASTATIVDDLLNPLYYWITNILCKKPLEEIINILPTLAYSIKNALLESLLDALVLDISIDIEDLDDIDLSGGVVAGLADLFKGAFRGKINDAINDGFKPLELFNYSDPDKGMVQLYDILEMDNYAQMRDMTSILNAVIKMMTDEDKTPVTLDTIDQNKLAGLGSASSFTSQRSSTCINNFAYRITADKPSVLYDIFTWVFRNYGNSEKLIALLQTFDEDFHLNEVFTNLVDRIGPNYNDCFAALVELFYPQQYGIQHTTYKTSFGTFNNDAGVNTSTTALSATYLKYGNLWTEEKAANFYNNAEELINNILKTVAGKDKEAETLQSLIDGLFNGLFNTEALAGLSEVFAGLAELEHSTMEENEETGELEEVDPKLGPNITQLIRKELGGTLDDYYGDLYDIYRTFNDETTDEEKYAAYNAYWGFDITNLDKEDRLYDAISEQDFFRALSTLIRPVAPVLAMLFGGQPWKLLTGKDATTGVTRKLITFNGYKGYQYGLLPVFETLGMKVGTTQGLLSASAFNALCATACSDSSTNAQKNAAYDQIVAALLNPIMNQIDVIMANPIEFVCTELPNILYQFETGALRDYVFNSIQGLLVILDTVRPVFNFDLPALAELLDKDDAADMVKGLAQYCYTHSIKDALTTKGLFQILKSMLHIDGVNIALESINAALMAGGTETWTKCINDTGLSGVRRASVNTTVTTPDGRYYQPWDVLTVLLEALLEICQNPGNADAVEMLIGDPFCDIELDEDGEEISRTPKGIIATLVGVLNSELDTSLMNQPINWLAVFTKPDGSPMTVYDWIEGSYSVEDLTTADTLKRINVYLSYNENYTQFKNVWNEQFADYLDQNLANIVDTILKLVKKDDSLTLAGIINDTINSALSPKMVNDLCDTILGLLTDIEAYISTIDLFLDVDLSAIINRDPLPEYKTAGGAVIQPRQELNEETNELEWVFKNSEDDVEIAYTLEEFINAFVDLLEPVSAILDWLLLGKDYEFFNGSDNVAGRHDGDSIIRIPGADGYDNGIMPLLEAVIRPVDPTLENVTIYSKAQITGGEISTLGAIATPLYQLAEMIFDNPVDSVMDILSNLIYFININGLSSCLNNILAAVWNVVDIVDESGLLAVIEADKPEEEKQFTDGIEEFLKQKLGVDLKNLKFSVICNLLGEKTGLDLTTVGTFFEENYYLGYVDYYQSRFTGDMAAMMRFTDYLTAEGTPNTDINGNYYKGTRSDFFTIIFCLLLDVAEEPANRDGIIKLLAGVSDEDTDEEAAAKLADAEGKYEGLLNLLSGDTTALEAADYDWTTLVNNVRSDAGITRADACYLKYNTNWTRDTARQIYENDTEIINSVLALVAAEDEEPQTIDEIINNLLYGKLYTEELVSKLYNAVIGLVDKINALDNDGYIANVVKSALDVDLGAFDELRDNLYVVESTDEETGEPVTSYEYRFATDDTRTPEEKFVDAVADLIAPLEPIFDWLFAGKNLALFTDYDTEAPQIVIKGAYGYRDGIYTLLKELNIDAVAPATFAADLEAHDGSATRDILEPVVDWIADIAASPVHEAAELLPQLIYFLQTNNLKVAVTNGIAAIINVLDQIRPIYDVDLEGVIATALDVELEEGQDIWDLIAYDNLINLAEEATGMEISTIVDEAISGTYFPTTENDNGIIDTSSGIGLVRFNEYFQPYDALTILVSVVVELLKYGDNAVALETLLNKNVDMTAEEPEYVIKPGTIEAILNAFTADISGLMAIDWFYFDEAQSFDDEWITQTITMPTQSIVYLDNYASTNWNKETVDYLDANFESIVNSVITLIYESKPEGYTSLGELLEGLVSGIYNDDIINGITGAIIPLMEKIDQTLTDTVKLLLGLDLTYYKTLDPDKVWGIDSLDDLVDAFYEILTPLAPVLNWLLLDADYTFLDGSDHTVGDGNALITINGADGYDLGIVPLLEAIAGPAGIELKSGDEVKAENAALKAAGEDENAVIGAILDPIVELYNKVLSDDCLDVITSVINNLIYFINANGVSASLNNALIAVFNITDALGGIADIDLKAIVNDAVNDGLGLEGEAAFDMDRVSVKSICNIVEALTGLNIWNYFGSFLEAYFIGELYIFKSAAGVPGVRLQFNEPNAAHTKLGTRGDFITCLVSLLLDTAEDPANYDALVMLLAGEDADAETIAEKQALVDSILTLLDGEPEQKDPEAYDWTGFINGVAADPSITAADACYLRYTSNWSRDLAKTVYNDNEAIVNNVLALVNEDDPQTLDEILANLIDGGLFSAELVNKVYDALMGLYEKITEVDENGYIVGVLKTALNIDFSAYETLYARGQYNFADGDREAFVDALAEMLAPVEPILGWLFAGKNISLFVDGDDASPQIVLKGENGYGNGLVELYKALNMEPVTEAQFKADLLDECSGKAVKDLLNPIVDYVDKVADAPLQEVCKLIPQVLYFVQSGQLEPFVKNTAAAVLNLLERIDGIYHVDLAAIVADALDIELEEEQDIYDLLSFDNLIGIAEQLTGLKLNPLLSEAISGTYWLGGGIIDTATGKVVFNENFMPWDVLTMVLAVAIELVQYDGNTAAIEELANLEPGTISAILDVFNAEAAALMDIEWFWFDEDFEVDPFAEGQIVDLPEQSIIYLDRYSTTIWNKETVDYLDNNLESIIDTIITLAFSKKPEAYTSLSEVLTGVTANIFNDDTVNSIVSAIVPIMDKIDDTLADTVKLLLGVDLTYYKSLTGMEYWGVTDLESFIAALKTILTPIAPVLNWLLLGEDYGFLNSSDYLEGKEDGDILLTIQGGEGYACGLIPLIEAIVVPAGISVKSADQVRTEVALGDKTAVVSAILDPLAELFDKLIANDYANGLSSVDIIANVLNNLFYFINANGLSASVHNMLTAVYGIVEAVEDSGLVDGLDVNGLINDLVKDIDPDFDIERLTIKDVCTIVENSTGLDIWTYFGAFLSEHYLGHLRMYRSANEQPALWLEFNEANADNTVYGTRGDFFTCVISLLLDTFESEANSEALIGLLGNENIYNAIIDLLSGEQPDYDPYAYDWNAFIDGVAQATDITPADLCYLRYSTRWTRDLAKNIYDNSNNVVDNVLALIAKDGEEAKTLEGILGGLITDNLYTADLANKIYDAITDLYLKLADVDEDGYIAGVLKSALDIDLTKYDALIAKGHYVFSKGNEDKQFLNALAEMLAPVEPILEWLLFNKDIKIFVDGDDGEAQIVLKGADGYANGLTVLFNALTVVPADADAVAAAMAAHDGSGIKALLQPVIDLINRAGADPVKVLCNLLPQLLFYVQSGQIDATIHNVLQAVFGLVDRIGVIADIDLDAVIEDALAPTLTEAGITVGEGGVWAAINLDSLVAIAEAKTGLKLNPLLSEAINGTYFAGTENCIVDTATGKVVFSEKFQPWDVLTMILSAVVELAQYDGNEAVIEELANLPEGSIATILDVFSDEVTGLMEINWFWFDETFRVDAFAEGQKLDLPEQSIVYLENYAKTKWNEEVVDYVDANMEDIINTVITLIYKDKEGYTGLGEVLQGLTANLFSDDTINGIVSKIVPLMSKIDEDLANTVNLLLNVDLGYYTQLDGEEAWGVYDMATLEDAFVEILTPLAPVLNWLLLDEDFDFLNSSDYLEGKEDGDVLLTINGADGYDYGLVPLLEAIVAPAGIEVKSGEEVKAELAAGDDGAIIRAILDPIVALFNAAMTDDAIDVVCDVLNNLFYFINTNGISACINNMLIAVLNITDAVNASGVAELDLKQIANDALNDALGIETFDIDNFDIKTLCDIVKAATGLDIYTVCGEFLEAFYCGHLYMYKSANGQPYVRLVLDQEPDTDEDVQRELYGTRGDFLTIILSLLLQVVKNEDNKTALIKLLGDDEKAANIYRGIINVLNLEDSGVYDTIDWLFTDEVGEDGEGTVIHTAISTGGASIIRYGKYWTREKAEYVDEHLDSCIDSLIHLLGIEGTDVNGKVIKLDDLDALLEDLVSGYLYTEDLANKILNKLLEVIGKLDEIDPDGHIKALVKRLLGVDLSVYDNFYEDYDWGFEDGDRAGFTDALLQMLMPIAPILNWLFFDETWSFFVDENATELVNLPGGLGYKYGIIPILEALDCEGVMTQEEYAAAVEADPNALLTAILDPLFDKIDDILTDPANKIMDLLPRVIYFIESDGLSACWVNLLHAVYTVTTAISPIYDVDLAMLLFKMDIHTVEQSGDLDLNRLLTDLLAGLENKTGFQFAGIAASLLSDLSTGTVYRFTSKNGRTAYSMKYASSEGGIGDRADLITAVLCIAMEFIATGNNAETLCELVEGALPEESSKYVTGLIKTLKNAVKSDPKNHVDIMLGTMWYVFYGADIAVEETDDWLTNYNNDWQFIIGLMEHAETDALSKLGKSFADMLDKYLDDIYDSEGLASGGLISFFQKIKALFEKIIQFFKNLFS